MRRAVIPALMIAISLIAPALADSDTEAKLREALRTATAQQRALEDERTVLQAKLSVAEKERDALKAQIAGLATQLGNAKKETVEQASAVARLETQVAEQTASIDKVRGVLGQCRTSYQKAMTEGQNLEAARKQLVGELDGQTRRAEACEVKNVQLYKVGSEILNAYADTDFADVVGGREPFLGLKRVELETLVQDYKDKLLDGKVAP